VLGLAEIWSSAAAAQSAIPETGFGGRAIPHLHTCLTGRSIRPTSAIRKSQFSEVRVERADTTSRSAAAVAIP
jgi:hypothetical protein